MCDSIVVARPGEPVWIAKNSDRDPDEVQVVDRVAAAEHRAPSELRCSEYTLPQAARTLALLLSRPEWMWGCEMGVNSAGVAIANEAVFTRLPVAERGLSGMDLQRLALERSSSSAEAVEVIIGLLADHPQGGPMGAGRRYHSSFLVADATEAWLLETAGHYWALQRIRGVRSISNSLTIEGDFERVHPQAYNAARARGWCRSAADFGFARAFGSRFYRLMSAAQARARCAAEQAELRAPAGDVSVAGLAAVLRDHGGLTPAGGWRMRMPCAHASYLPTRARGQTTGSMIARLSPTGAPQVWMTGTSSPCLSIFKPLTFRGESLADRSAGEGRADELWWAHERLHRATILNYRARRSVYEHERAQLEARAWRTGFDEPAACAELWAAHQRLLPQWTQQALACGRARSSPFYRYWRAKARAAGLAIP